MPSTLNVFQVMLAFILPLSFLPLLASPSTGTQYKSMKSNKLQIFQESVKVVNYIDDEELHEDYLKAAFDDDHTFRSTNDNTGLHPVHTPR